MVRHLEEIQEMRDELIYIDVHGKKSDQSFNSKSSGRNPNESVFGEVSIKDATKPGSPTRQEKESKVMDKMRSHETKNKFSPACLLSHNAVAERQMTSKRQSRSDNKSLPPSPARPFSIKKVTPYARRTPNRDTALYDEGQQKNLGNEHSQGKDRVNISFSKEVLDTAPDTRNFELQRGKQKQRKRSLRNIAVSTDDLSYGSGDRDDDKSNDFRNESLGNENLYQMNNNGKPTRFIIIERRGPRVGPDGDVQRRRNRHNDLGTKTFRGRKFEGRGLLPIDINFK